MILKHVFEWPAWGFSTHQKVNTGNKGIIGKTMVVQEYEELTETGLTLDISHRYWNTGGNESQKLNPDEPTHRVRVTVNLCDN